MAHSHLVDLLLNAFNFSLQCFFFFLLKLSVNFSRYRLEHKHAETKVFVLLELHFIPFFEVTFAEEVSLLDRKVTRFADSAEFKCKVFFLQVFQGRIRINCV